MENVLKILDYLQIAYAALTADREIIAHNSLFAKIALDHGQLIEERIPELVGLEKIVRDISNGRKKQFVIHNILREIDGRNYFFSFYLFPLPEEEGRVIFIATDVTEKTENRQKILQQQNEILLLQRLFANQSHILSSSILGNSPPIRHLRKMVEKISRTPSSTILLQGESGTGKNLVARVLHYNSIRAKYPFVEINCAAIPEPLLEAELFGYEKGAFTNAFTKKQGLLEEAHQGTLFLDEIAEIPLKLQAKLLSVLESKTFRRLGSNIEHKVEFRLIAATNRNLPELVRKGEFREDLYFRLNVIALHLPPLRELGEDVFIIADHFRQVFNKEFKKNILGFSEDAKEALLNYHWPGNVRELSNCIERAMIFSEGPLIQKDELVFQYQLSPAQSRWELPEEGVNLEKIEIQLIKDALKRAGGNKTKAARLLGLSRDTLRYRLEKYNLAQELEN